MLINLLFYLDKWSEWRDSNPRPLVPQTSALTGLRYTPTVAVIVKPIATCNARDCRAGRAWGNRAASA